MKPMKYLPIISVAIVAITFCLFGALHAAATAPAQPILKNETFPEFLKFHDYIGRKLSLEIPAATGKWVETSWYYQDFDNAGVALQPRRLLMTMGEQATQRIEFTLAVRCADNKMRLEILKNGRHASTMDLEFETKGYGYDTDKPLNQPVESGKSVTIVTVSRSKETAPGSTTGNGRRDFYLEVTVKEST